jgi:hypothetical protein
MRLVGYCCFEKLIAEVMVNASYFKHVYELLAVSHYPYNITPPEGFNFKFIVSLAA